MRAFLCLLLVWLMRISFLQGQELPKIIPPSPESSSLFKFSETPVSLYDGLTNVSVPIYTIRAKGIEVPISLNYHSRGILVEEIASRVGIGWALSAGGAISRQVRNKSDDSDANGYLTNNFYSTFFTDVNTQNMIYGQETQTGSDLRPDFDPDLFFFSFPGHSGRFIFDQATKKPLIQEFQDIIISPIKEGSIIQGFKVMDESGNIFYFGTDGTLENPIVDKERSTAFKFAGAVAELSSGHGHINTWHLIKIETYLGDVITFNYTTEGVAYYRRSYDKVDPQSPTGVSSYFSKISNAFQRQIESIEFPEGRIDFIPLSTPREDLDGSYALDEVKISNKNNELIDDYKFHYFYQHNPADGNELAHLVNADPRSLKRLFLSKVQRIHGTETIPAYEFEYSAVLLPNRFSNSQDLWGYFNGAENGAYLTFFNNGDRGVDSDKCGAGLLKKVRYPTGGSVEFEYEQNQGEQLPGMTNIVTNGDLNPDLVYRTDGILKGLMYYNEDSEDWSKTIVIKGKAGASNVVINSSVTINGCPDGVYTTECNYTVSLQKINSTEFPIILKGGPNYISYASPGEYTLLVSPNAAADPEDYHDSFAVSLGWEEDTSNDGGGEQGEEEKQVILGGGKRIKKIKYTTSAGLVKTKEYTYLDPNGETSGKILGFPNFYSIEEETPLGPILKPFGSVPGSPLTSVQGNKVGYSHVQEYFGDINSNIGKTTYEFTAFIDGGEYYKFPYHLPIDNEWLRGKPRHTKIFEKIDSGYKLLKTITNNYYYSGETIDSGINTLYPFLGNGPAPFIQQGDPEIPSLKSDRKLYCVPLAVFTEEKYPYNLGTLGFKVYYQLGGVSNLYSTVETDFFEEEGVTRQLATTTNYYYNYDNHYQMSRTETRDSKNNNIIEETYFPTDVTPGASLGFDPFTSAEYNGIERLKATLDNGTTQGYNRLVPVQNVTTVEDPNGIVLSKSAQRTIFADFHNRILPQKIEISSSGNPLEERSQFVRYDDKGNPLEVIRHDGVHVAYIWGYNKTNPVAEIINATYNDVEAQLGIGLDLGAYGLSDNQKSTLRAIPLTEITTYDYKLGVGVRGIEDGNGQKITYRYDEFNRLSAIIDNDDNIIEQTLYKYGRK